MGRPMGIPMGRPMEIPTVEIPTIEVPTEPITIDAEEPGKQLELGEEAIPNADMEDTEVVTPKKRKLGRTCREQIERTSEAPHASQETR